MSPGDISHLTKLPKLKEDGSNWSQYVHHIRDHLYAKGLRRHLNGFSSKPKVVIKHEGKFYLSTDELLKSPLSQQDVDDAEAAADAFYKEEGQGLDVLNLTLPPSIEISIRNLDTLAEKWQALHAMFEHRGAATRKLLLQKLTSLRYSGGPIRNHINTILELRDQLIANDYSIDDEQLTTYITTSLTHNERYDHIISSMEVAMESIGQTLTSEVLIRRLINDEERHIGSKSASVSSSSSTTALASSSSGSNRHGKKGKSTNQDTKKYHCDNCGLDGHSKERCFAPGGGRASSAPEWWKKKWEADHPGMSHTAVNASLTASNKTAAANGAACTNPSTASPAMSSTTTTPKYVAIALGNPQALSPSVASTPTPSGYAPNLSTHAHKHTWALDRTHTPAPSPGSGLLTINIANEELQFPSFALSARSQHRYLGKVLDCGASHYFHPRHEDLRLRGCQPAYHQHHRIPPRLPHQA